MGRRTDHTRDELKEQIITTARHIVETEGFAALSAREIARRIGYTVGTLYNVFENFNDIILHVNGITLDELYLHLKTVILEREDDQAIIHALGMGYIEFASAHSDLWDMLFGYHLPPRYNLPAWYTPKVQALFTLVEHSLEPLMINEERDAHRRAATVLWAGMHGICTLALSGKLDSLATAPAPVLVDAFITDYLKGLTADR